MRPYLALISVFLLSGCERTPDEPASRDEPALPAVSAQVVPVPPPKLELPATSPEMLDRFTKGSNSFGFDLYRELSARGGNLSISPMSISVALAMAWAGARGETEKEMAKVLHFDANREETLASAGELLTVWSDRVSAARLELTQRLFGQKNADFEPLFLGTLDQVFDAPLERVDFISAPDASRKKINQWVLGKTNGRIKDLLQPADIQGGTRLVLVNALYFQGEWQRAFSKKNTKAQLFHLTSEASKSVQTMRARAKFRHARLGDVSILDAPFSGGELSMTFILPHATHELDKVEAALSSEMLDSWLSKLVERTVQVAIPRFTLNPVASLRLKSSLKRLGMQSAFSKDSANFNGIAKPNPYAIYIEDVVHKTYVRVDEKGTEAAAATAVVAARGISLKSQGGAGYSFIADHPFLFIIRDQKSKAILFVGRVVNPTSP